MRITCVRFLGHQNGKIADMAERSLLQQIGMKGLEPYPKFSEFVSAAFLEISKRGFSEAQVKKMLLFSKQCFTQPVVTDKLEPVAEWGKLSHVHSKFYDICMFFEVLSLQKMKFIFLEVF